MKHLRVIATAALVTMYATPAVAKTPASLSLSALVYDFIGSAVTTDPSGKSHQQVMMRGHATTTGNRTRIDITDAGSISESMRGSYLLLSDGGRRALWVNPALRQYRETDPESLLSGFGALGDGSNGLITMTASNVHVDAEKVGPGPVIQGHSTVHYRLSQTMDMKTKIFKKTLATHDESVTDYYYATDVPNVVNPFLSSAPSLPQDGALVFTDDYTRQLRNAIDKLYQGGAPLRTIVSDKSTNEFGHVQSTVTTTEMMNLKQVDVSAATFDLPIGFIATPGRFSQLDGPDGIPSVSSSASATLRATDPSDSAPAVTEPTPTRSVPTVPTMSSSKRVGIPTFQPALSPSYSN